MKSGPSTFLIHTLAPLPSYLAFPYTHIYTPYPNPEQSNPISSTKLYLTPWREMITLCRTFVTFRILPTFSDYNKDFGVFIDPGSNPNLKSYWLYDSGWVT